MQSKTWLNLIDAYIEEHLHEPDLTVETLAQTLRMSTRQLGRRFRAAMGDTPSQYLKEKRLQRAYTYIIEQSHATVAEVSEAVGYKDTVYFSQQFRKRFGKYPSEYWFGEYSQSS